MFASLLCHTGFRASTICLRMRFEKRFLCYLWMSLPVFWKFHLCLFLSLMKYRRTGFVEEEWSFRVLDVAFQKDLWISLVSASISMRLVSGYIVSFWFIWNLLQLLANVFQSVCSVWCCPPALYWVLSERTVGRWFGGRWWYGVAILWERDIWQENVDVGGEWEVELRMIWLFCNSERFLRMEPFFFLLFHNVCLALKSPLMK